MSDSKIKLSPFYCICILATIISLPLLSIDIYIPVLHIIAKSFATTNQHIQLSVSTFMLGLSIAQIFSGALSDEFGRKNILCSGLLLYIAASVCCMITASVYIFLLSRFMQGVSCSAVIVSVFAISRDLYKEKSLAHMVGYVTAAVSFSPVVAPAIGTLITLISNWRYIFLFLAIINIGVLFMVYYMLPETACPSQQQAVVGKIAGFVRRYKSLINNITYIKLVICLAIIYAAYFACLYNAPFIYEKIFAISTAKAGMLISCNALALVLGSAASARVLKKLSANGLVSCALFMIVISSITLVVLHLSLHHLLISVFVICIFINTLGVSLLVPLLNSKSMSVVDSSFGSASALSGFVRYGLAAGMGAIIAFFKLSSIQDVAFIFIFASLFVFVIMRKLKRAIS